MKLRQNERVWAPAEHPEYLCLLIGKQQPPKTQEEFLLRQTQVLRRLLEEASPGEIKEANRKLQDEFPPEMLEFLPTDLLPNPRTVNYLLFNPMSEGTKIHQWKWGVLDLLDSPPMPEAEALEEARTLDWEVYLDNLM